MQVQKRAHKHTFKHTRAQTHIQTHTHTNTHTHAHTHAGRNIRRSASGISRNTTCALRLRSRALQATENDSAGRVCCCVAVWVAECIAVRVAVCPPAIVCWAMMVYVTCVLWWVSHYVLQCFKVYVVVPHGWWERMVQVVCVRQCALQCVLQCVVIPQDSCNMMVQTAYTKQSKLQSVLQSVAECVTVCIVVCVATCVVAWH